jgi:hypothetical protein
MDMAMVGADSTADDLETRMSTGTNITAKAEILSMAR